MLSIDDDGKIWLRGFSRPEYGVKVGELYFITGKEDAENVNCFIHENYLFVDLHYPEKQHRVLRRFAFDLEPKSAGILFSGFTETKHADIKAITYRDEGVEEYIIDGKGYSLKGDGKIDPIKLMELAGLG